MKSLKCWQISEKDFPTDDRIAQIEFMLRYSILAPSKYNRQPWKFQIVGEDTVNFFLDLSSPLPTADPYKFEMLMSAGAVLKLFLIASEFFGFDTTVELFPDSNRPDLYASVKLREGGVRSSQAMLCREITRRATARSDFAPGNIETQVIEKLIKSISDFAGIAVRIVDDEDEKKFIAEIVGEAEHRITSQPNYHAELKNWLRTNFSSLRDGLPAYAFGISGLSSLLFPKLLYKKLLDPISGKRAKSITERAPLLAIIGTEQTDDRYWLETGGAYIVLALTATQLNLTISTYDLLFNIPELIEKLRKHIEETRYGGFYPRMVVRLGYALKRPPTPRKELADFLIKDNSLPPAPEAPIFGIPQNSEA